MIKMCQIIDCKECVMSVFETIIQETHLDIFGHVNNAKYLELFEQARWAFLTERGYGLDQILKKQQGPVILEAHLKFLKELKHREKIKITFEMLEYQGKIGKLKQQMLNVKGDVCAELLMVFGLFDIQNRKLLNPTDEWLSLMK